MSKVKVFMMILFSVLILVSYLIAGVLQLVASLIIFLANGVDRCFEFDGRDIEYSYLAESWDILRLLVRK